MNNELKFITLDVYVLMYCGRPTARIIEGAGSRPERVITIEFDSITGLEGWVVDCLLVGSSVAWETDEDGPIKLRADLDRLLDESLRTAQFNRLADPQLAAKHDGWRLMVRDANRHPNPDDLQLALWPVGRRASEE